MFIDESQFGSVEFHGDEWDNHNVIEKLDELSVTELHLVETKVDDHFFQRLPLENLNGLFISSRIIGDFGIRRACERFCLETLSISAPRVTDYVMESISECNTISGLTLTGTSVTDEGMAFLSKMPRLWSLNISDMAITDSGISSVGSNTIDQIIFENCSITGTGFSTWNIPSKSQVNANGSRLNDTGFFVVCEAFAHLWEVSAARTDLADRGLRSLAGKKPINEFSVENSRITLAGIEWLFENIEVGNLFVDPGQVSSDFVEIAASKEGFELAIDSTL